MLEKNMYQVEEIILMMTQYYNNSCLYALELVFSFYDPTYKMEDTSKKRTWLNISKHWLLYYTFFLLIIILRERKRRMIRH